MLFGLFIAVTSFNLLVMFNEMYNKPLNNENTNIYTNASFHNISAPFYNTLGHNSLMDLQQEYILNMSEFKPTILYRLHDKPYYSKDLVIYQPIVNHNNIFTALYLIRLVLLFIIIYYFWIM